MKRPRKHPLRIPLPKHLRERPERLAKLRHEANGLRGLYGVPVWLCGSALLENNPEPRDWDLRIELPDADFEVRYGSVNEWIIQGENGIWNRVRWRWSDDCVKQTKKMWHATRMNIDFQVYPLSYCKAYYWGRPSARLDTRGLLPRRRE